MRNINYIVDKNCISQWQFNLKEQLNMTIIMFKKNARPDTNLSMSS